MSELETNRNQQKKRQKTGGRAPGVPNKATREFRETVTKLLSDNADNVAVWLERVATGGGNPEKADPGKALDLMAKLAEFAAPKLARTEVTGAGGGPVVVAATNLDERL
ncbi:hypothetical protein AVMA1855_20065 [Acidovorax sp. SUPP1855]|uniref:hypothetical protein n=1 Tax=Acidovorax sp. SUPP1855 TaxID=431774 RepID=UPI0023DE63C0|nr:hypothetical protein [Acidovorax sp. SUPP1855]GKS86487.1 hypothetical protein AVMA1855_20065 [Acidovorax sp. SUPP1855]